MHGAITAALTKWGHCRFGWEWSCSLNPQHHPMKHACNQQGHSSTDSFQPNSSITAKLDPRGPPFWLCADQPTRTERSISSMLTLTGLQSGNTIHDKLSPNSSWTGSNSFSLFSFGFFSFFSSAPPGSKTKRHYLSLDEVMTEMSVAGTLTWHGVKISKWKPRNGTPRAAMFQHETRLPLMWSAFWSEQSGSFDVRLSRSIAVNGWKSSWSGNADKLV